MHICAYDFTQSIVYIFVRSFDKSIDSNFMPDEPIYVVYIPVKRCLIPFNHPSFLLGARRKAQHISRRPWPGIIIYSISLSNLCIYAVFYAWDLYPRI